MARPNLLLCFDAFGTLFRPKRTVALQYAEVARQCGITSFSDRELQASLLTAFKEESKQNPNYGKATGLGATKWWTNVIYKTFTPLLKGDQSLPKDLSSRLLHRFASDEGYDFEPNLLSAVRELRQPNAKRCFEDIVVGIITNSDDRVPGILSSAGINVSPLRYGTKIDPSAVTGHDYDIDFHCMSYDVGVEKPDRRIFDAADLMLAQITGIRNSQSSSRAETDGQTWRKLYVGDDYAKDVVGSAKAGWNPVLLDAEEKSHDIPELDATSKMSLDGLFKAHSVVRVKSIRHLTSWLSGTP